MAATIMIALLCASTSTLAVAYIPEDKDDLDAVFATCVAEGTTGETVACQTPISDWDTHKVESFEDLFVCAS